jgi:hypothetical protein
MKKIDRVIGAVFFGFILFITCFCAGWWVFLGLHGNVFIGFATGTAAGIAANILFLKKILSRMYTLGPLPLMVVFLLYSVGIFGFFMGVPVFNAILGVAAGWYAGRRAKVASIGPDGLKKPMGKAILVSTAVLFAFCAASAWIALADSYTAANLQGMLNLGFPVTTGMIWGIILIGGALLLVMQALAAKLAAKMAYRIG